MQKKDKLINYRLTSHEHKVLRQMAFDQHTSIQKLFAAAVQEKYAAVLKEADND